MYFRQLPVAIGIVAAVSASAAAHAEEIHLACSDKTSTIRVDIDPEKVSIKLTYGVGSSDEVTDGTNFTETSYGIEYQTTETVSISREEITFVHKSVCIKVVDVKNQRATCMSFTNTWSIDRNTGGIDYWNGRAQRVVLQHGPKF